MATTRWTENRAGVAAFLESGAVDHLVSEIAHRAVAYARSIAPVGSPIDDDDHPGAYRDSIQAEPIERDPGWRVFAADNKAHWIEYGAAHTTRQQVLTRAVETVRNGATMNTVRA